MSNDMEVVYALFETRQILGYLIYVMLHKLDCTAEGGEKCLNWDQKRRRHTKKQKNRKIVTLFRDLSA